MLVWNEEEEKTQGAFSRLPPPCPEQSRPCGAGNFYAAEAFVLEKASSEPSGAAQKKPWLNTATGLQTGADGREAPGAAATHPGPLQSRAGIMGGGDRGSGDVRRE